MSDGFKSWWDSKYYDLKIDQPFEIAKEAWIAGRDFALRESDVSEEPESDEVLQEIK